MSEIHYSDSIIAAAFGELSIGQSLSTEFSNKGAKTYCFSPFPLKSASFSTSSLSIFLETLSTLPRIDVLIFLLPVFPSSPFEFTPFSSLSSSLDLLFVLIKSVWKKMRSNKHGRILTISPSSSFYSSDSTLSSSSLLMAHYGLMKSLAREGSKFGVKFNLLLFATEKAQEITETVSSVACFLCHSVSHESGSVFEVTIKPDKTQENNELAVRVAKIRVQRGSGWVIPFNPTAEEVKERLPEIAQFGKLSDFPEAGVQALLKIVYIAHLTKPKL
jgi:hypothetical protein